MKQRLPTPPGPRLSVETVMLVLRGTATVADLDRCHREAIGLPSATDPRRRCVGTHVVGRDEAGDRIVRAVYLGVFQED